MAKNLLGLAPKLNRDEMVWIKALCNGSPIAKDHQHWKLTNEQVLFLNAKKILSFVKQHIHYLSYRGHRVPDGYWDWSPGKDLLTLKFKLNEYLKDVVR